MTLLRIQHLRKEYQERVILSDVSFHVAAGDKIGLLGVNGSGKSTLLRILSGLETPDDGEIQWVSADTRNALVYMAQEPSWDPHVLLADQLAGVTPGWLSRCGISADLMNRPAGVLSGGEKTRAALAQVMSLQPELLLLDEPTNHLDVNGLVWLETVLSDFAGSLLVVSHDRYFLDKVVHRVLELDDGCVRDYRGNYSAYAQQKLAEHRRQEETYEQFVREKKRLEEALKRKREWAEKGQRNARNIGSDAPIPAKGYYAAAAKRVMQGAKAVEKRLQRLHAEKPKTKVTIDASLGDVTTSARHLVVAERIGFRYPGGNWLFRDAQFFVERGDRLSVVGNNGTGKSTLIRLLLGELKPTVGVIRVSPVRIGYLAQEMVTLQPSETLLDCVRRGQNTADATGRARDILAHMLFGQDWIYKRVHTLSGGEKVRLAFACILFDSPDFLVLDEPTNALDLASREAIEEALAAFRGTILFVSHDRYLLQRLATKVLSLEDGCVRMTLGGYDDYLRWRDTLRPAVETEATVNQTAGEGTLMEAMSERDRKLLLETRLAVLSQQLAVAGEEAKVQLTEEFIRLQREVNQLVRRLT